MEDEGGMRLVPLRAGTDDGAFAERLWEYWRDLGVVPPASWHAHFVERWRQEEGRSRHTFWGELGGRRIGFVMVRLDSDWLYPERLTGYIAEFTVFAPWRRRGLGGRLFSLTRAWLRERGCGDIELDVLPGNRAGQAFWRSVGFALVFQHLRVRA